MTLAVTTNEREIILATVRFANLPCLTSCKQVEDIFRGIKNVVMVRRTDATTYREDQDRLRNWLSRITTSLREANAVAREVAPFLEQSIPVKFRLQARKLDYVFSTGTVLAGYAWGVALLVDETRGMTSRLQQCGCGKFRIDFRIKGRPPKFCNKEHKALHDAKTRSKRAEKSRERTKTFGNVHKKT